jgi:hypothetical protein
MLNVKPKYLVDEQGKRTAVVLSMRDYHKLLQRLEELEDALDLDEAVEAAKGFRDYNEIRAELQKEGRI